MSECLSVVGKCPAFPTSTCEQSWGKAFLTQETKSLWSSSKVVLRSKCPCITSRRSVSVSMFRSIVPGGLQCICLFWPEDCSLEGYHTSGSEVVYKYINLETVVTIENENVCQPTLFSTFSIKYYIRYALVGWFLKVTVKSLFVECIWQITLDCDIPQECTFNTINLISLIKYALSSLGKVLVQ